MADEYFRQSVLKTLDAALAMWMLRGENRVMLTALRLYVPTMPDAELEKFMSFMVRSRESVKTRSNEMAKTTKTDAALTTRLKACCPDDCHPAVDQMMKAGFSPMLILGFIMQYGPQLAAMAQQLLEMFKKNPPPVAAGVKNCPELVACQREHLLNALADNLAMEQDCCDDEDE